MKSHVRLHNGTPTLFLDGQPVFANCHLIGGMEPQGHAATQSVIRAFAGAGVHIYSVDAVNEEWYSPRPSGGGPFDFSTTITRLQYILEADPDALFLLRMGFDTKFFPADWWNQLYPDEVEVLDNGARPSASFASPTWRAHVQEFLRGYIDNLTALGLYDRVIAYQIACGTCGEWIKDWSSMSPPSGDFSPAMRQQFQTWLRAKYGNSLPALQAAWANPAVTFDTAQAPSGAAQAHPTHYQFRDPRRERQVIDFYECYAETAADALLSMCHAVKAATGGDKITGAFFGYLMELAWNNSFFNDGQGDKESSEVSSIQRSGHLGLAKALRSPDIDFFVSPYSYAFRGLGGDGLPMQPTESLRVHNKLYFFEEDTLMHNNFEPQGRMHPKDQTIPIYQRNFAQCLTHGLGITWLESYYFPEDPRILAEARRWQPRYQALGTWALDLDRAPSAEVAVFLDDESYTYEGNRNDIDLPLISHQRVVTLNRFGAPHDLYLLNDLLEDRLPDYKLYIFLNAFHLNNQRRRKLHEILGRGGRTALWFYAPGYINSDAAEPLGHHNMTDLTGFTFGQGGSYWSPFMHLTDFRHPISHGLPQDLFWGTNRSLAPIFHLADPQARVLGEVVYGLGRCQPGFALKNYQPEGAAQPFSSVYVATPTLPPAVLRGVARHAGVHLYNEDGDVLYATPSLLSVHTVAGGQRTFKLPQPVEMVYDLFANRIVARDAAEFYADLAPASTALYYTGPAAALASLPTDFAEPDSLLPTLGG